MGIYRYGKNKFFERLFDVIDNIEYCVEKLLGGMGWFSNTEKKRKNLKGRNFRKSKKKGNNNNKG